MEEKSNRGRYPVEEKRLEMGQDESDQEIDLLVLFRDFIRGCIRFWWLAAALALIGGAVSYFYASGSYYPMYRSEATFTVTTSSSEDLSGSSYNFYYDSATADQLGLTFPYILSSDLLTDAMKEDLGVESLNGSVSAVTIPNSNLVTMYGYSSDPEDARTILESALRVYPDVSRFVIGETRFNMIDPPTLPAEPYNTPNYRRQTEKGALIGLAAGIAFIALYAFFRKTVHNTDELKKVMNLPCLVSVPLLRQKRHNKRSPGYPSILNQENSPWLSEAMETLRLRVTKAMEESGKKVLLVTSSTSGEGKSLIAANLAFKLAQYHKKVLLVDVDLRKQNLAKNFGISGSRGFDEILSGKCSVVEAMTYDEKSGVFFLGGSTPLKDTSSILSREFQSILDEIYSEVDYIILDAPPCGGLEDAYLLSEYADAVLYVIMHDKAVKSRVVDSIASLEAECDVPVIGYVFNGLSGILGGSYGYSRYGYGRYGYGYGRYSKYGKYGRSGRYGYGEQKRKDSHEET